MNKFAKLFEYPDGQLLVTCNYSVDEDRDEIVFRSDVNGMTIEQKLGLPRSEKGDMIFDRINADNAKATFNHLCEIGKMGTTDIEEPTHSAFNLAIQVENMRNAQIMYFRLIAKARKSKLPEDFAKAEQVKQMSMLIERSVDDTIREILHPVKQLIDEGKPVEAVTNE